MLDFMLKYGNVVTAITSVLEAQFTDSNHHGKSYLSQSLKNIITLNNQGKYRARDVEILRFSLLAKNIKEIKTHNSTAFSSLRKQLLRCRNHKCFIGLRMEINAAASFSRKKIQFAKRESPDFSIQHGSTEIFVECTSVHVKDKKNRTAIYKLKSAIQKKSKTPYCNLSTALFIDWTNILYHELNIAT